jgi:hypothetical protein
MKAPKYIQLILRITKLSKFDRMILQGIFKSIFKLSNS